MRKTIQQKIHKYSHHGIQITKGWVRVGTETEKESSNYPSVSVSCQAYREERREKAVIKINDRYYHLKNISQGMTHGQAL